MHLHSRCRRHEVFVWEIYPTCSQLTSTLLGATTSRATNTGAQKTSGQTNPRARLHQGDADLCAGGAPGYSRFIPPGGPSRPWQLIRFRHFCSGSLALASLNRTCRNLVPTFPQRSPPWLLTAAACGGLRSTPDCRPRRTCLWAELMRIAGLRYRPGCLIERPVPIRRGLSRRHAGICVRDGSLNRSLCRAASFSRSLRPLGRIAGSGADFRMVIALFPILVVRELGCS
jgi:hypothetical protein